MPRTGNFSKSCLTSTVKNTSGVTKRFGFLPPHGVQLVADEEYTVFGNILSAVGRGGHPTVQRRNHQAFFDALDAGDIDILNTPAPIFQDTATEAIKTMRLTSGTLSAVDPCWDTSDSLADVVPG